MSIKYKKILTFIGILITLSSLVGITYLFYEKKDSDETLVEANGELSINYINGKKITKDGTYEFSITNNSDKDFYYEIGIRELASYNNEIKYSINSSEASINMSNISLEKDSQILVGNVLIKSKATENFEFTVTNIKNASFKLVINKMSENEEYFFATILNDNEVKKEPITKPSTDIANTSEGLIEDIDDYGLTYYFRGKVDNNYVKFADLTWRIVRINGDGTVKLILNDSLNELGNYSSDIENIEKYEETDVVAKLNSYYESVLKSKENYIANTKFCKEKGSITTGNNKTYNAYTRLITNSIPTFNCLGETYRTRIGLITADEVAYAGGNFKDDNKDYYLYNDALEDIWWTSSLASTKDNNFYPFSITAEGKINNTVNGTLYRNIRPVINIIKKVTVRGSGTISDPYIINE